jgi:hypothetical protein
MRIEGWKGRAGRARKARKARKATPGMEGRNNRSRRLQGASPDEKIQFQTGSIPPTVQSVA